MASVEEFFADLGTEPTVSHLGAITITTFYGERGGPERELPRPVQILMVLISPLLLLLKKRLESPRGTYVRAWFPDPLCLDLNLASVDGSAGRPTPGAPSAPERAAPYRDPEGAHAEREIRRCFSWTATDDGMVLELLRGGPGEVLEELSRKYAIDMTDAFIQFGPVHDTPRNSAAVLKEVIRLVLKLRPRELKDDEHRCPACHHAVPPEAAKCPDCGLTLK